MTIKHSSLDVYFHMRNHYKKLRLAKAVIKNRPSSAPKKLTPFSSPARNDVADKTDEEPPQPSKQVRPASETNKLSPANLQKLKKAHYPYHSIHLAKHDCSRPVTRRNLLDMPDSFESPTRLSQVEEREWDQPDDLLEQLDVHLEQPNALLEHPGVLFEQPDKLEKDSDHDDESLRRQNADWSGLKQDKRQQLGCVCGAIYAGGDETYGNSGAQDVGYLEIWEFDKGQESKQGSGKHEGRKSISKVYTVLPVITDLPCDSPDGTQKEQSGPKRLYRCTKISCQTREERGLVKISEAAENKENPVTEKYTSESETETSKQDSGRDDDVTQNKQTIVEIDQTQRPADDSTKTERPSRSRYRPRPPKPFPKDSMQVARLKKNQDVNGISPRNKSTSRELQRDSSNTEKSRSSSEEKTDSTRKQWSTRSSEEKTDSSKKQCSIRGCSVIEHEYLQFSLRITEDIIRNDLYNNDEMKRVFNSHIEANRGRLDMNKMKGQIQDLCKELNIAYDEKVDQSSCREDVGKVQENLKNIICFSSPHKQLCLPCVGQLTSQVKVEEIQILEEKSSSAEAELKAPSQTSDKPTLSIAGEKELRGARNKMKTPPLQTIAEVTPPNEGKQLRNKTAKVASFQTDESTAPVEKQLKSAGPYKNKTATPAKVASLQQTDEFTPPVEKQLRNASPARRKSAMPTTSATPTKAGNRPKTKQSFPIGETDEGDRMKPPVNNNLSEVADDAAMKSSEQIEESKPEESNAVKTDYDDRVRRVSEDICPVCCARKPVCLPLCLENLQPTHPETRLPTASLGGDARRKSASEEVKPNLIFVSPPISSEKKDFAAMIKQPQKDQTTQGPKIKADYPVTSYQADKTVQEDILTGIPALDETLRNYNLEMLAQNCGGPPTYECQTQAEPSYNLLHETYKYKCTDFVTSQKATDEFVVVSGPIYIPTHVIEPSTSCNCAPLSSFLKPLASTCAGETCKSLRMKKDLKQINLLLTDDYNSRNRPDISIFYPTVSTQTSSTDFANRAKLPPPHKSLSSEPVLLKTPPMIVAIDSLNKIDSHPARPKKERIKLPPEKKEETEDKEPSSDVILHFDLADTLKEKQRLKKELRMKDMIAIDEEEDAEKPEGNGSKTEQNSKKTEKDVKKTERDSGKAEVPNEGSSEMFLVEMNSSREESEHLKHKVNQIIDMRGNDNGSDGSSDSINNGRILVKSSSSDAVDKTPQIMKQVRGEKENRKKKETVDASDFMKKLDHKPDMSMTNSMANSIKKVNRDSQQFRSPDDKRITWGNRRLKIKKLTDSNDDINVIQEEEEEQDNAEGQSIKSENYQVE